MEYRRLRSGTKVSALGLGCGYLRDCPDEVEEIICRSMDAGVNFMDTTMYDDSVAPQIRDAVREHGDGMVFQLQTGVHYPGGEYAATRNPEECRQAFETELRKYGLDHADLLLFHCVDELSDADAIIGGGLYDMMISWKEEGRVDNIGFGSHSVEVCRRFMERTEVDDLMLSMNPAYDFVAGEDGLVIDADRTSLYRECESRGIGIVAMKPYGGGILMDDATSPFGRAMTVPQCIQYVLDRPAVVTTIPGVASLRQTEEMLGYLGSGQGERDYSFMGGLTKADISDQCMYCNHCLPCTAGIDIGMVNRFHDLAAAGDEMAARHYADLSRHASDCVGCGDCTARCPFGLDVVSHIDMARRRFGLRSQPVRVQVPDESLAQADGGDLTQALRAQMLVETDVAVGVGDERHAPGSRLAEMTARVLEEPQPQPVAAGIVGQDQQRQLRPAADPGPFGQHPVRVLEVPDVLAHPAHPLAAILDGPGNVGHLWVHVGCVGRSAAAGHDASNDDAVDDGGAAERAPVQAFVQESQGQGDPYPLPVLPHGPRVADYAGYRQTVPLLHLPDLDRHSATSSISSWPGTGCGGRPRSGARRMPRIQTSPSRRPGPSSPA